MKILVDTEIQKAVLNCKPSKIAVAYIGTDWQTYIPNPSRLNSIIVSPTFGSNPWAINDLATKIGWDRIFFLDELHAKTYIGKGSAVIGSANLTHNGLGTEGLVELCVEIHSEKNLQEVGAFFEVLKKKAQKQYPTQDAKKKQIKELEKNWGAAIANRIVKDGGKMERSFMDFEPLGDDHFYVLWFQSVECDYSDDVKAVESLVENDIHFAKNDMPGKNKWALLWQLTNSSAPHKKTKPYWLYIHDVFENGVIDEGYEYPKLAIQRKDLEIPQPPFDLTDDVIAAFKYAIQQKIISKYLIQEGTFNLAYSHKGMPLLIKKMKDFLERNNKV